MPSPEIITHWPVRAASMEPLDALSSAPSFTALATCAALLWLVYRAWLVMVIKEDDLIKLLGLDVPAAPQASLAGIKADAAILHWEPAEPRGGVQAYQIKINGVLVEEVGPKDTSVNIANLKPATAYTVRVIAINHHNFHTQSDPIRFRTKLPSSDDFVDFAAYNRAVEIANDDEHENDEKWWVEPKVAPCKGFLEPSSPMPTPSDMVRSHSNSTSHPRRVTLGRRNSPANPNAYQQADDSTEDAKSGETEAQLQAEGDRLRSDIATTRKAIDEEERGFKDQKDVFSQKNNELKDELTRKTAASTELRKEVVNLEKENQRAQAKKTAEEKSLQQKFNERKKMQDDVQRFKVEIDDMAAEIERIGQQKEEYQQSSEQKAQELREKHSDELQTIKTLEESVREIGIQNRILEEERKKYEGSEGDIDAELRAQWAEEERQWNDRIRGLQQRYQAAWASLQAADRTYNEAQAQLQILSNRAANQPQVFRQPPTIEAAPSRRTSQRRRPHAGSIGNDSFSAAPGSFPVTAAPYNNNNSISNISPSIIQPSPFFNFANGAVPISNRETSFSLAEIEMLTGGAPMSPNAGALLPSDLFSNETDRSADESDEHHYMGDFDEDRDSSGSRGGAPDVLAIPGLGALQARDPANRSPSSPASAQSRSPSLFASPRGSSNQLSIGQPQYETGNEADAMSVKSLSGSTRGVGGSTLHSRFGQLFNRQRGKTMSDQGPALGSLKPSQSHSVPRPDPAELDPIGAHRRRGSHSGGSSWMDSMSKPFRSSTGTTSSGSPSHVQTRKRGFKLFPSKDEEPSWPPVFGMERPSSPRPGSTRSFGDMNQLPRPSTESSQRFGWGPAEPPAQRSSPLNTTVELGINTMSSFSRHQSRRPSIQYGPSTGLGYEDVVEDNYDFAPATNSPPQAPIGTRPPSQPQPTPATPPSGKLNPAAPVFKGLWGPPKNEADMEKPEKGYFKAKANLESGTIDSEDIAFPSATVATDFATSISSTVPTVSTPATEVPPNLDVSPISIRKSRDGRASTVTSNAETASLSLSASWSPRASLDRSDSRNSESLMGTSTGKESWMSKLSRKGSSSKFQLPGFGSSKEKGSGFFSRSPRVDKDSSSREYDDDDASAVGTEPPTPGLGGSFSASAASSPHVGAERSKEDKKADRGSGLSWSSLRRKKRGSEKAPSINESVASERDEEEAAAAEAERDAFATEGLGLSGA